MTTRTSDYRRLDHEYECGSCGQEWARCACPKPDAAAVAARIAAERARLLGKS